MGAYRSRLSPVMDAGRLHPVTLQFASPYVEAAFRADHARRSVKLVRASLVMGLGQFALFGLLDKLMVPSAFREIQLIRLVACVLLVGCIAYTFAPSFLRRMQGFLVVPPLIVGFAVTAMAVAGQQASEYYDYYAGLILVLIYVHVLLRLRFVLASAVGNMLIAVFLGVSAWLGTPGPALLNTAFFVLSANATGMIASYALEHYARRVFFHTRQQEQTNAEMAEVLNGLRAAQDRLVQQEKMASLGRLTAGIAHEIKNPLNFVNNFAALSGELVDELDAALANREGRPPEAVRAEVEGVLADLRQDVAKIREHGERADAIVRGMLEHARTQRGTPQRTDLNALVEEHVEAACAHFADRHDGFEAALDMDLDAAVGAVAVVPQEISRVVAGLVNNALYAVRERARAVSMGDGAGYVPAVTVRTGRAGERVRIEVADNGVGIPAAAREHVFEPFFTTKPAGEGTGLGLSLAYDLITHGHGGALTFESEEGRGTTFTVTLPAPPLAHEVQVSEAAAFA